MDDAVSAVSLVLLLMYILSDVPTGSLDSRVSMKPNSGIKCVDTEMSERAKHGQRNE